MRYRSVLSVVVLALIVGGCKSESESAMSDMVSKTKDAISVLKSVTDQASANAAAAKLKSMESDMKAIQARLEKAKPADAAEAAKLVEKYMTQMIEVGGAMAAEQSRIQKAGLMTPELMSALNGVR